MLKIEAISAFNDNYIWLLHDDLGTGGAWVVDPGDAAPVLSALKARSLRLAGILVTHHHPDHVGGVAQLRQHFDVPVYGPADTPARDVDVGLREGDAVEVLGRRFAVIAVPGHTLDHIAYYSAPLAEAPRPLLFCGDTLFAGGCGRVFEGTFPMMYASLQKLAQLPAETQVYCAHEYTLANLRFALAVEPDNPSLQQRRERDTAARARHVATVPSTLALELDTNPFLRCAEPAVRRAAASHASIGEGSDAAVFGVLRSWKDSF